MHDKDGVRPGTGALRCRLSCGLGSKGTKVTQQSRPFFVAFVCLVFKDLSHSAVPECIRAHLCSS